MLVFKVHARMLQQSSCAVVIFWHRPWKPQGFGVVEMRILRRQEGTGVGNPLGREGRWVSDRLWELREKWMMYRLLNYISAILMKPAGNSHAVNRSGSNERKGGKMCHDKQLVLQLFPKTSNKNVSSNHFSVDDGKVDSRQILKVYTFHCRK